MYEALLCTWSSLDSQQYTSALRCASPNIRFQALLPVFSFFASLSMAAQTVLLFLAFESVIRGPSTDGGPMCNLRFRSSDNSFNNLPPETWCMYLGETWSPVALTGPQRDVLCRVWSCHRATTTYTCTTSWNCGEPRQLTRYDGIEQSPTIYWLLRVAEAHLV